MRSVQIDRSSQGCGFSIKCKYNGINGEILPNAIILKVSVGSNQWNAMETACILADPWTGNWERSIPQVCKFHSI